MTENAIEVHNLSKMFKLYPSQGKRFLDYLTLGKGNFYQEFWALRDITFTVPKGCAFGILGQNGSGKSTLLSILAGVLEPTLGSYHVQGRVSAILELGAGFHPEFTGRANAYMYGSIMGLSREDIDDRMPDIIHFSELGDFIDQPLRTYSSGMYARLAFSVAVNVDADVLIVDEALAVGDALFQHRCFRKIRELKESGKTILYVGHDTEAVRSMCDQAMILDGGRMRSIGDSARITNEYLALIAEREQKYYETNLQEFGEKPGKDYEVVYNFIDHLNEAEKTATNNEYIRELRIEIKNTPRRTIFAQPPSDLLYRVFVNPGTMLSFAIGIYSSVLDQIIDGIRFSVWIDDDEVFFRTLKPKRSVSDRGWHNQTISLSAYEGREVSIRFITEGSEQEIKNCWGGWGWPSLYVNSPKFGEFLNENNSYLVKEERFGSRIAEIIKLEIFDENGNITKILNSGDNYSFKITAKCNEKIEKNLVVGLVVKNRFVDVFGTNTLYHDIKLSNFYRNEIFTVTFIQKINLNNGIYSINCGLVLANHENDAMILDRRYDYSSFMVTGCPKVAGIVNTYSKVLISRGDFPE